MARRVDDRLHPAVLAPAPRPRRETRESRAEDAALPPLPRSRPARARRAPQDPQDRGHLPLGHRDHHRLEPHPGTPAPHLTSTKTPLRQGKESPGPWSPRPPGPTAGSPACPAAEKPLPEALDAPFRQTPQQRERSRLTVG